MEYGVVLVPTIMPIDEVLSSLVSSIQSLNLNLEVVILNGDHIPVPRRINSSSTIIKVPKGSGQAMQIGFKYALKQQAKYIFRIDGDGQYKPELIPEGIKYLEKDGSWVLGSRFHPFSLGDEPPIDRLLFNKTLTPFIRSLTGWDLTDCVTGFWGFTHSFLNSISSHLNTEDYGMTLEIILKAKKLNLAKPQEIPHPRIYSSASHLAELYTDENLRKRMKRIYIYYILLAKICRETGLDDSLLGSMKKRLPTFSDF